MTKKPLTKKCTDNHCKLHHVPFTLGYNYGFYPHFLLSDHNNHEVVHCCLNVLLCSCKLNVNKSAKLVEYKFMDLHELAFSMESNISASLNATQIWNFTLWRGYCFLSKSCNLLLVLSPVQSDCKQTSKK
jgi:hypothetical protein